MDEEKFNVLYVDDEENNLISFRAAFRRNYNIFTATSAAEGIRLLHQHTIPIIITDQRMPQMTGVQFLEKIIPEYPDTIRMILTGFSDIEAIIQAINTGRVFRYITKPWDENELKMTIDNAISLY
ncbi:MAG TPA: response regulator, partial [Chitinophagales bacterium]|nr:response regulator [Chitinophagales bacterium]